MVLHSCEWCGNSFAPRTNGGKPQRFCSGDCRKQFHAACRLWGQDQGERGLLPISAWKCALAQRTRSPEGDRSEGEGGRLSWRAKRGH